MLGKPMPLPGFTHGELFRTLTEPRRGWFSARAYVQGRRDMRATLAAMGARGGK